MKKALLIALVGVLVAACGASSAGAVVVHLNGKTFGVTPRAGVSPTSLRGAVVKPRAATADNGTLDYNGGPVLHSSTPYLIFWDPNNEIPAASEQLFERYFTDVAADSGKPTNVYAVASQYSDGSGNAAYAQTYTSAHAIVDTDAYPHESSLSCPTGTSYPHCVTDTDIQSELSSLIKAKSLPIGLNPIYFVITPKDTNVCMDSADCTDSANPANSFCAYHSNFGSNTDPVLYASIPLFFSGGPGTDPQNPKGCQYDNNDAVQEPNNNIADVALKYLSHEDNETITDPVDGSGWIDDNTGQEDGDECNFYGPTADPANDANPDAFEPTLGGSASTGVTDANGNPLGSLYDQLIDNDKYYLQSEWSNATLSCEMRPAPVATFSSSPSAPLAHQGVSFHVTSSSDQNSGATLSYQWNFGDGTTGLGHDVTHTYATPGTYTVTLTVSDNFALSSSSSQLVTVNPNPAPVPSFTVDKAHPEAGLPVRFDGSGSSDADASIVSYSWSFGDGSSATTVSPSHTYMRKGSYTVTLTVTDSFGERASTSQQVKVRAPQISASVKHGVLRVSVDQGGVVKLGSHRKRLTRAGTVKFKLALSRSEAQRLHSGHAVKVKVKLQFVPLAGASETKDLTVTARP